MNIIEGFLAEEDVSTMSDALILSFGKMCNDILAEMFRKYIESDEADSKVKKRINDLIGDIVYKNTFHYDVINKGVRDIILGINLETLPKTETDYNLLLETFDYVEENKGKMLSTIDPRSRTNYKEFVDNAKEWDNTCIHKGITPVYPNLSRRIAANKRVFYSPNEKPISTRLHGVLKKTKECIIAKQGILYMKYCEENNIQGWRRREF